MSDSLLSIKDLHVRAEEKEILHGISLEIKPGETHVIMGPNGAGKSTLGNAIMGNPSYEVTEGEMFFEGKSLSDMAVSERAKSGIYMSFQNPLEVPGVTLGNFIKTALEQRTGKHKTSRLQRIKKICCTSVVNGLIYYRHNRGQYLKERR